MAATKDANEPSHLNAVYPLEKYSRPLTRSSLEGFFRRARFCCFVIFTVLAVHRWAYPLARIRFSQPEDKFAQRIGSCKFESDVEELFL